MSRNNLTVVQKSLTSEHPKLKGYKEGPLEETLNLISPHIYTPYIVPRYLNSPYIRPKNTPKVPYKVLWIPHPNGREVNRVRAHPPLTDWKFKMGAGVSGTLPGRGL